MVHAVIAAEVVILGIAIVLCGLLTLAKEAFRVDEDRRIQAVVALLPQANCGACGFAGCHAFARAVVEGRAECTGCPIAGPGVARRIGELLGIAVGETAPRRPVIHCAAGTADRLGRVPTEALSRCLEAHALGVTQACTYGCLGFGDCVEACEFDALHMVDGLPEVDYDRCVGCGACADVCPRDLIELVPFKQVLMPVVACANREPGRFVRQVCRGGCIACGRCQRCLPELFHITENLAILDYEKLTDDHNVAEAIQQCPTAVIKCVGLRGAPLTAVTRSTDEQAGDTLWSRDASRETLGD